MLTYCYYLATAQARIKNLSDSSPVRSPARVKLDPNRRALGSLGLIDSLILFKMQLLESSLSCHNFFLSEEGYKFDCTPRGGLTIETLKNIIDKRNHIDNIY